MCGSKGDVGDMCKEKACKRRGVHFIPDKYFEKLSGQESIQFDTMIGQLIDAYLVVDKVGAGGFGKVYLGLQLPIMLEGAIKLLSPEDNRTNAESLIQNFQQEAQSLARLTDPHIVKLQRYGVFRETPYMVMEYVKNARTLKDAMDDLAKKGEKFSLAQTSHIIRQILSGLKSTHRLKIVHRDIKPANIMLQRIEDDDFFVRIVDFGLAKFIAARTYTDTILGTPVYMAPEQITKVHIGPWTDLYAVGVIGFEMLTGRTPFKFRTFQELLGQKISPDYDPLEIIADLDPPDGLKTFFKMALARKHEDRYKTVDEFRVGFDNAISELSIIDARTIGLDPFSQMAVSGSLVNEKQRTEGKESHLEQEKEQLPDQQVAKETNNELDEQKHDIRNKGNEALQQKAKQGPEPEPDNDSDEDAKRTEHLDMPVTGPSPNNISRTPAVVPKSSSKMPVFLLIALLLIVGVISFVFLRTSNHSKSKNTPTVALAVKPVTTQKIAKKQKKNVKNQPKPAKKHAISVKQPQKHANNKIKTVNRTKAVVPKTNIRSTGKKSVHKKAKSVAVKKAKKTMHAKRHQKNRKLLTAKQYKEACDSGDKKACYKLATLYDDGKGGVKKDHKKAAELYNRLCSLGNAKACYNLGLMYQNGQGVKKSYRQAAVLYKKSCNRGQVYGCLGLGLLYVKGRGVKRDYDLASDLFKKACDKGSNTGCKLYDSLDLAR